VVDASLGAVIGYFLGSIPFGLLLCLAMGKGDVRKIGSGNIGATNVLRTGSKPLAILTLFLDAGKAAAAVYVARWLFRDSNVQTMGAAFTSGAPEAVSKVAPVDGVNGELGAIDGALDADLLGQMDYTIMPVDDTALYPVLAAGLAAMIGHMYPIWLKGRGGKGVATFIGMVCSMTTFVGLGVCVIWLSIAAVMRISSLSALCAVLSAPLVAWALYGDAYAVVYAVAAALVWYKHKDNIRRLIAGTEPRIGDKTAVSSSSSASTLNDSGADESAAH